VCVILFSRKPEDFETKCELLCHALFVYAALVYVHCYWPSMVIKGESSFCVRSHHLHDHRVSKHTFERGHTSFTPRGTAYVPLCQLP
jgi:hypothetical protein